MVESATALLPLPDQGHVGAEHLRFLPAGLGLAEPCAATAELRRYLHRCLRCGLSAVHGAAGASPSGALHGAKRASGAVPSRALRSWRRPLSRLRLRAGGATEKVTFLGFTPRWLGTSIPVLALGVKPHL